MSEPGAGEIPQLPSLFKDPVVIRDFQESVRILLQDGQPSKLFNDRKFKFYSAHYNGINDKTNVMVFEQIDTTLFRKKGKRFNTIGVVIDNGNIEHEEDGTLIKTEDVYELGWRHPFIRYEQRVSMKAPDSNIFVREIGQRTVYGRTLEPDDEEKYQAYKDMQDEIETPSDDKMVDLMKTLLTLREKYEAERTTKVK